MKKKKNLNIAPEKLTKGQLAEISGGMDWRGGKQSSHFEDRRGKSFNTGFQTGSYCNGEVVYSDNWV